MEIPVFVSAPTQLSAPQEKARSLIVGFLHDFGLTPRALGRTDYPTEFPLREVYVIAKHCSGGVILGFEQFLARSGVRKRGTKERKTISKPVPFPTPWNHLEAGILFALSLPLLVFKEEDISGGVFDSGVTDVFIHKMPMGKLDPENEKALREVILNWQRKVRNHYYDANLYLGSV